MLYVEIRTARGHPARDILAGTISLDGDRLFATPSAPKFKTLLDNIMTDTIAVRGKPVKPSAGAEWIKNLYQEYKSYALRATEARERSSFHLEGQHEQLDHGNRNGGSDAPTKAELQKHLVDYKEDRPLTGPGTAAISEIISGAESIKYMDVPGIEQMHAMMGIPNPTLDTDQDEYADAREALFKKQTVLDAPFERMVFTQPRVNTEELKKIPQEFQKKPVMTVKRGGKYYLINGHHRVVGQFTKGARSVPSWVLDLDLAKLSKSYHLEGEHDQKTHGNWATDEKSVMESKFLLGRASSIEPIATKALNKVVGRLGGEMKGLDFKLKSEKSLLRKIRQKLEENPGLSPTDAMLSVSDSLRYTATFPAENYAAGVYETLGEMELLDFKVDKIKNYWCRENSEDCSYQGINVRMLAPDGLKIELQFHTEETFQVKEIKSHPIYEALRTTKDPTKAKTLKEQLTNLWRSIKVPANAAVIGI